MHSFFYRHGDLRDLHSFPTRRSSDLTLTSLVKYDAARAMNDADPPSRSRCMPNGRSEEHTSELQSQSNLVCRLLLEKKKGTAGLTRRVAFRDRLRTA